MAQHVDREANAALTARFATAHVRSGHLGVTRTRLSELSVSAVDAKEPIDPAAVRGTDGA